MSKLMKRITDLIARSASDNKEEARTAAWIACKLIRENSIVLSEPDSDSAEQIGSDRWAPGSPANPFGGGRSPWVDPYEEMLRDIFQRRREARTRAAHAANPVPCKFPAVCKVCGGMVNVGEPAWWHSEKGTTHRGCGPPR